MYKRIIALSLFLMFFAVVLASDETSNVLPKGAKIIKTVFGNNIVEINSKQGIYTKDFKEILPPKYKHIEINDDIIQADGKFGICQYNNLTAEPVFNSIQKTNSGTVKYSYVLKKGEAYYILGKNEKFSEETKPIEAYEILSLGNDYLIKKEKPNGKYAVINLENIKLTGNIYDEIKKAEKISYGLFIVTSDNKSGVVKTEDNLVKKLVPLEFDKISDEKVNYTYYNQCNYYLKDKKDVCNGIPRYSIKAQQDNKNYVLNIDVDDNLYQKIEYPIDTTGIVIAKKGIIYKKDNKYGFIGFDNKTMLNNEYDLIYEPKNVENIDYLFLKKGDKFALYNAKKDVMTDFIYDNIYIDGKTTIIAQTGKKKEYYNKLKGNVRFAKDIGLKIAGGTTHGLVIIGCVVALPVLWPFLGFNYDWSKHPYKDYPEQYL